MKKIVNFKRLAAYPVLMVPSNHMITTCNRKCADILKENACNLAIAHYANRDSLWSI